MLLTQNLRSHLGDSKIDIFVLSNLKN